MFGYPADFELYWANQIRLWAMGLTALAAFVSLFAGWAQIELQTTVSAQKEEALRKFQADSHERIATAQSETARAHARADEASAAIAEANARAAEATRIAESERLERVKIEERLAPRAISAEQFEAMRGKLKPVTGHRIDIIVYPNGTSDILPLSFQIGSVLHFADPDWFKKTDTWPVRRFIAVGAIDFISGIQISTHVDSGSDTEALADLIIDTLRSEGRLSAGRAEQKFSGSQMPVPSITAPGVWTWDGAAKIRILVGTKM